ncbi:MAG: DEDD exonuclease domain-containing protein [Candidatus Nanopelagicales bacterium]
MSAQMTLDDLGTPLREVTFVVVDLETDGGSPEGAGITEFGAVKVCRGEEVASFQSLVRLGAPLSAFISALTGITDSMLATAPELAEVLPAFLDFANGAVIVAHNAPYDVGFLKGACAKQGLRWPEPVVLDTAKLARNTVKGEVLNCKLSTLARHFRTRVTPNHRALADAQATVDVLHGLIERVGNLGVHSLEELVSYSNRVAPERRRKRHLADDLPAGPGVYIFEDARGVALYVGTSKSIRTRVRSYFTSAEQRPRMNEMVGLADRVVAVPCSTQLEAQIRELRIIAARSPQYNRRSKYPQRACWLKLTVERYPRISVVGTVKPDTDKGARYVGPFLSRRAALTALEAISESLSLRTCSQPLTSKPKPSACVLAELGRCPAPCVGAVTTAEYAALVAVAAAALSSDPHQIVGSLTQRMSDLCQHERYEDAATWRDRLATLLRGIDDSLNDGLLARMAHIVAARATDEAAWEVHVIRHGRLAAAGVIPRGADPAAGVAAIVAAAESVSAPYPPATAATPEETALLRRWLYTPGTRLVEASGPLELPARSAGRFRSEFTIDLRVGELASLGD